MGNFAIHPLASIDLQTDVLLYFSLIVRRKRMTHGEFDMMEQSDLTAGQERLTDMHAHILYGVDDGDRTKEESIELVRMAMRQGVRRIVATPQYAPEIPGQHTLLLRRLEETRALLRSNGLHIPLEQGNEVLYFDSIPEHLRDGRILTLGGTRAVLIEFYPAENWNRMLQAVRRIMDAGFVPVLAHVERYQALYQNDPDELRLEGAYLQINADSLEGNIFSARARFCKRLLLNGRTDFVSSDMHRSDVRPPRFQKAVRWIRAHLPKAEADAVLYENAERLLRSSRIS